MRMSSSVPNSVWATGPRTAKPTTKEACSARMKRLFAVISWSRLTTSGIIAASAGAKNVVSVATSAVTM